MTNDIQRALTVLGEATHEYSGREAKPQTVQITEKKTIIAWKVFQSTLARADVNSHQAAELAAAICLAMNIARPLLEAIEKAPHICASHRHLVCPACKIKADAMKAIREAMGE